MAAGTPAELFFDDVHVPAAGVLGEPDQAVSEVRRPSLSSLRPRVKPGFALLMRQFTLERLVVAMGAAAHAAAALRETVAYTKQRSDDSIGAVQ
ncbi:acyl-CoA dehydrogenase family protein [Streptomyces sp. NPDC058656]|uniref:acyl-CoA dehydrogenase family protein n=1 Tax=unclassified Streptomyces TaxID=2593676 RepID=UPI00366827D5